MVRDVELEFSSLRIKLKLCCSVALWGGRGGGPPSARCWLQCKHRIVSLFLSLALRQLRAASKQSDGSTIDNCHLREWTVMKPIIVYVSTDHL